MKNIKRRNTISRTNQIANKMFVNENKKIEHESIKYIYTQFNFRVIKLIIIRIE